MTLGERCDEIMRLIDETLADVPPGPAAEPAPEAVRPLQGRDHGRQARMWPAGGSPLR